MEEKYEHKERRRTKSGTTRHGLRETLLSLHFCFVQFLTKPLVARVIQELSFVSKRIFSGYPPPSKTLVGPLARGSQLSDSVLFLLIPYDAYDQLNLPGVAGSFWQAARTFRRFAGSKT